MARIPSLQDFPTTGAVLPKGSHLQQLVDAARALADAEGYNSREPNAPLLNKWVLAKTTNAGPNGEADGTREIYWLQLLGVTAGDWDQPLTIENDGVEYNQIFPASNSVEWQVKSHCIPKGELVWARPRLDRGDPLNIHWVFTHPITWRVKVTASAAGGGIYTGNVWNVPTSDVTVTSNLTEAMLGTAGPACIILNHEEVGQTSHDIISTRQPLIFLASFLHCQSDGTPVFSIGGAQWKNC